MYKTKLYHLIRPNIIKIVNLSLAKTLIIIFQSSKLLIDIEANLKNLFNIIKIEIKLILEILDISFLKSLLPLSS